MNVSEASKILGLRAPFTARQAKTEYRRLAMAAHPDKQGGSTQVMKKLNEAYSLVSKGLTFGPAPKIDVSGVKFAPVKKKLPSYKQVVNWFSQRMIAKLDSKRGRKFGWRLETSVCLLDRLEQELKELKDEMCIGKCVGKLNKQKLINECADVANFALMIADNANRKLK